MCRRQGDDQTKRMRFALERPLEVFELDMGVHGKAKWSLNRVGPRSMNNYLFNINQTFPKNLGTQLFPVNHTVHSSGFRSPTQGGLPNHLTHAHTHTHIYAHHSNTYTELRPSLTPYHALSSSKKLSLTALHCITYFCVFLLLVCLFFSPTGLEAA